MEDLLSFYSTSAHQVWSTGLSPLVSVNQDRNEGKGFFMPLVVLTSTRTRKRLGRRSTLRASRDEAQIRIREFAKKKSLALDDRTRVESDGSFRYG